MTRETPVSDLAPLSGPSLAPAGGGEARSLVILLHGVGADGHDLIGLAPHWADELPGAAFVSPHAPFAYDMAPMGYQWFSLLERDPDVLLAGVRRAAPALDAFIDAEVERWGLAEGDLALVGFSQGAMMALHVGLRRDKPVAGILGFSGALIGPGRLGREMRSRPPVLLVHGDEDPVVPVEALPAAVEALTAHGVQVESHIRPGLGHGIDGEGVALAARFLVRVLAS